MKRIRKSVHELGGGMSTDQEHNQKVGVAYDELNLLFDAFAQDFHSATGIRVDVEPRHLLNICESYVYDIYRYISFHELEIPDRARRAAYLCKWLMRFRPVFLISDVSKLSDEARTFALLANELFSMYAISGFLRLDLEAHLSARLFNIVLYSLRYRAHSEDAFILFFASVCGI
jgi:hypothetical protein